MTEISAQLQPTLHHVGYLVKDIPAAAAHYCDLLGYRMESAIIADPQQTAKVQFLRQPGANNWLELVSPDGAQSKLTAALQKGVLLHHLCYEVADMEKACAHFRASGCFMVGEPAAAAAFPGRRIAWFMDSRRFLFELLERGSGPLSLASLATIATMTSLAGIADVAQIAASASTAPAKE